MKFSVSRVVAACSIVVCGATIGLAQTSTSGSVRGVVTDPDGRVLPGVTVVAESGALVAGTTVAVSSGQGMYRFPSLPPGEYTFTAELEGFRPVKREGIKVSVGQALDVDLQLKLGEVTDEIVVVAQSAQVSTVSNTVSEVLDEEYLKRQPLPRATTELMDYTPGVNDGQAYGAPNSQASAYNLDGVDVSDPASGQQWILPNFDWVQETQVMGLGANAEYGGFTGATVNLVTKSGGNEMHGGVSGFYSGGGLNSENAPEGLEGSELDSDLEVSFSLGGPVIKDALWYFVAGENRERTVDPLFVEAVPSAYQAGQYVREYKRYLAKLTWQLNPYNKLVFLGDFDGLETDNANIGDFTLESGAYTQDSPNWAYNATWESLLGDSSFVSVKVTGFQGRNDSLPPAGSDTPGHDDYFNTGLIWGNYRYTWLEAKRRLGVDASWSQFADGLFTANDNHEFKFGIQLERSSQDEVRTRNGGFTYVDDSWYCDSLEDYFADPFCGVLSSDRGNEIDFHATQEGMHLYAQDSWTMGSWTINYGLRYTSYTGGFKNGDEEVYDVDMFSPRIGFVWDVLGDGSTALKLHYGKYYDALMAFMYDREVSGNVFTPVEYWDYNFDTGQFDIPAGGRPTGGAVLDSDIGHPYVDQWVLSLERQLSDTVLVGADYVRRRNHDIIAMINTNDDYVELTAPDNPLGGNLPFYELLSEQEYLLTNPSAAYREYDGITLRLRKRYADGWSLRASVVWSDLEGNTVDADGYEEAWEDWNGLINNSGDVPGHSDWEVKVDASVDLPWDIIASGHFTYLSGTYWTPYVTVEGLLENNRTTVNMEPLGSRQYDTRNLLDLHLEKMFSLTDRMELSIMIDVFNVFNSDTVLAVQQRWGWYEYVWDAHPEESYWDESSGFGQPTAVEDPREVRLGARLTF